jgi:hypothetical protein
MPKFESPDRVVIALGGNALGDTPDEQIARVREAAPTLLKVIEMGNEIIITHGNGPQVGMIQNAFAAANEATDGKYPKIDLPECGAMSQGYIGYHLQQAIGVAMHKAYKRWHVATVVTQIEVDPDDPSFQNPTKPIGAFMSAEQAEAEKAEHPDWTLVEDSGRGYRRVVASPIPRKIVEADSILNLLDNAMKYSPPGSLIWISASRAGHEVHISVEDDGPGVPDDQKPLIFDLFYTSGNPTGDSRRGLGVGLALCQSILKAHDGTITVSDRDPKGVRFVFTLPEEEVTLHE